MLFSILLSIKIAKEIEIPEIFKHSTWANELFYRLTYDSFLVSIKARCEAATFDQRPVEMWSFCHLQAALPWAKRQRGEEGACEEEMLIT